MGRPVAYAGHRFTIVYAIRADQTRPAEVFYDNLDKTDKAKINKLFEVLGDHGKISNKEKFKKIEGTDFFEFKNFQNPNALFLPARTICCGHPRVYQEGRQNFSR